jgi:hypothetical protein
LAGLRSRNHSREVGIFCGSWIFLAFSGAFDAPLLLVQLLLLTHLFSPAFVQFVILFAFAEICGSQSLRFSGSAILCR